MPRTNTAWLLWPAFLAAGLAMAQESPGNASQPTAERIAKAASPELCRHGFSCATGNLWRQERFELTAKDGGAPYIIQISLPASAPPADGYPVVYLLDAGTTFGTLADIAHYQELFFTPTVVVGVSYPDPFEVQRRDDFVPPYAAAFLTFLVEDVRAAIAARVKIDVQRQALFGHSLSALFVLNVLFTQPEAFDTFVAADPSIHLGGYRIIQMWPQLSERKFPARPRRLLLSRGTLPEGPETERIVRRIRAAPPYPTPPNARPAAPAPPAAPSPNVNRRSLAEFAQMMQSINGVETTYVEFPGETHQSMIPAYLGRGMRWTLMSWDPP
jgi:predicted alpha/beta superfamily hydrolase